MNEMDGKSLRKELIGKTVMTMSGSMLGLLDEIVVDTETGEIKYLLLRVKEQPRPGQNIDSKGRVAYAFNNISVSQSTITIS